MTAMRISANVITLSRIVLLPLPCALFYWGDLTAQWIAFALYIALGATDVIDGKVARKYGVTRLGTFLDPLADRIFVLSMMIAFTARGAFPWWAFALVFFREFLLTALQSAASHHHIATAVTPLGRLKTLFQMGAMATIFWTLVLPKLWMVLLCAAVGGVFIALWAILRLKGPPPFHLLPCGLGFLSVAVASIIFDQHTALLLQALVVVAMTWASAIAYIYIGTKNYRPRGVDVFDISRIVWSIAYAVFVLPLVGFFPQAFLALLVAISLGLAFGFLDNFAAEEHKRIHSGWFWASSTLAVLLGAAALATYFGGAQASVSALCWIFAALNAALTTCVAKMVFSRR